MGYPWPCARPLQNATLTGPAPPRETPQLVSSMPLDINPASRHPCVDAGVCTRLRGAGGRAQAAACRQVGRLGLVGGVIAALLYHHLPRGRVPPSHLRFPPIIFVLGLDEPPSCSSHSVRSGHCSACSHRPGGCCRWHSNNAQRSLLASSLAQEKLTCILQSLDSMRDLHADTRAQMPRRVMRTRLHDWHLAMQQTVDAVLHPVRDPVRALAHLNHQRKRRRRDALQHRLLCAARARLVITCARSEVRRKRDSMDSLDCPCWTL